MFILVTSGGCSFNWWISCYKSDQAWITYVCVNLCEGWISRTYFAVSGFFIGVDKLFSIVTINVTNWQFISCRIMSSYIVSMYYMIMLMLTNANIMIFIESREFFLVLCRIRLINLFLMPFVCLLIIMVAWYICNGCLSRWWLYSYPARDFNVERLSTWKYCCILGQLS